MKDYFSASIFNFPFVNTRLCNLFQNFIAYTLKIETTLLVQT